MQTSKPPPIARQTSLIASPSSSRATNRRRSSITERSFHGIHASPGKGEGVTHVSGTICHLCLGPLSSPPHPHALLPRSGSSRMRSRVTSPSNRGLQARTSVKITKMLQRPYRYGCKLTSALRLRGWLLPLTDRKAMVAEQKWKSASRAPNAKADRRSK